MIAEKWTVLFLEDITPRWLSKPITMIIAGTAPAFHKDCVQPTKMSKIRHAYPRGTRNIVLNKYKAGLLKQTSLECESLQCVSFPFPALSTETTETILRGGKDG